MEYWTCSTLLLLASPQLQLLSGVAQLLCDTLVGPGACGLHSVCIMNILVVSGELIVSKYVAESITMIAGRFGHEGLCQLRTELKKLQCEIGYIANTGQWCCVMLSGCINNQ